MAVKSVYISEPVIANGRLVVQGDEHQHLRVGRAEVGEQIEVFNGRGAVWTTSIESCEKRETHLRISAKREVEPLRPTLILGLSLVKTGAFELALEKAVEVGVTRIVPLLTSRTNSPPRSAGRVERWNRIVVEAAKQSKRYHLPLLDQPMGFADALKLPASTKIVFAERGGTPLQSALAGEPVFFLVGPEGGWTDEELSMARARGYALVGLGEGILRTETAAIVGAALIRHEFHRNL
jgi:16S rRNA (uracil1498-N3)-methyltransferase